MLAFFPEWAQAQGSLFVDGILTVASPIPDTTRNLLFNGTGVVCLLVGGHCGP